MRVLVTNDDGVLSPGLHALADAVAEAGHTPLVVAPDDDYSGCGGSIGPLASGGRIEYRRVHLPGDVPAFAVAGPAALCVIGGCLGGFGPAPEAVVAGVNPGNNTGRAVLHSGTVAAALTALTFGRPAVATSLALSNAMRWAVGARAGVAALQWLLQQPVPLAVSLNLPLLDTGPVHGVRAAPLAAAGIVQASVERPEEGVLELSLPVTTELHSASDTALVRDGYATVSVLAGLDQVGGDLPHLAAARVAGALEVEALIA